MRDRAFYHNLAYTSGESDWILMKILSQVCPCTRKFLLNFGSNPDTESCSRPYSPWQMYAVSDCSCSYLYCKYDFRHLHLSEPGSTELQQDVAMDTGSAFSRIPYNLYWRRKINKKSASELGADGSQMCKHHYIVCVICGLSKHMSAYNCVADCVLSSTAFALSVI